MDEVDPRSRSMVVNDFVGRTSVDKEISNVCEIFINFVSPYLESIVNLVGTWI